jgi:hypothetical protein
VAVTLFDGRPTIHNSSVWNIETKIKTFLLSFLILDFYLFFREIDLYPYDPLLSLQKGLNYKQLIFEEKRKPF